jgi:hypothetical protein
LILGGIGLFVKDGLFTFASVSAMVVFGFAGGILSFLWRRLIESYKQLNAGKFRIIEALEQALPASVFRAEWVTLGEGKDVSLYRSSTGTEMAVAWLFFALYVFILLAGAGIGVAALGNAWSLA